jgi:hypothetical protein
VNPSEVNNNPNLKKPSEPAYTYPISHPENIRLKQSVSKNTEETSCKTMRII